MWTKGKYYVIGGKKYKFVDIKGNFFTPFSLIFEDENGVKYSSSTDTPEVEWKEPEVNKTTTLKEEITKMTEALERKRQKLYEQAKVIEKKNEEIEGYKDIIKEQSEQIKDFTILLNDISSKILTFAKKWWGEENEQDN